MTSALFLAAAILLACYSNIVIKMRATVLGGGPNKQDIISYFLSMAFDPMVWTAVVAFVSATVLWLLVIRRVELSVAQPIMALIFVLVPLAASVFLGETLPPLRIAGIVCISLGVFLIARTA